MPYEALRFVHAANVRLDVPVSVHVTEQLTDELQHALEDATLTSFDSVIQLCLKRQADFLLLSGNIFLEADRSLRARLALLNGFRSLQQKQIPVFVLPGDADPPEAWRAIPEMPDNVTVCFSSNPEPEVLRRNGRTIATFSASMWYGETDAFGIRVIGKSDDGYEPFRIGIVSQAKYDESRRMASLVASAEEDFLNLADSDDPTDTQAETSETDLTEETKAEYEAGFRSYIEQLMTEGQLNYVAYMGELDRLTLTLETGRVHCPGTTQPRNQLETDSGTCSLVMVDEAGRSTVESLHTSAVTWQDVDLDIEADATLNSTLQEMKSLLSLQPCGDSDRIWAVRWTLRGPLPVLNDFIEEDLELAVAIELESLSVEGHSVRLAHEIRTLPDPWEVPEKSSLAQQYADLITADAIVSRRKLMNHVRRDNSLSDGWKQRFESLVAGVDRERILARMRVNGAEWYVEDLLALLPDLDDFDEDILQDEEIEEYGLTDDESQDSPTAMEADVASESAQEILDNAEDEPADDEPTDEYEEEEDSGQLS